MPLPRGDADSLRGGGRRPAASPDQAPVRKAPRPGAPSSHGAPAASRASSTSSRVSAPREATFEILCVTSHRTISATVGVMAEMEAVFFEACHLLD
eukprot:10219223-Alexandrium_andersonii.AAC.1